MDDVYEGYICTQIVANGILSLISIVKCSISFKQKIPLNFTLKKRILLTLIKLQKQETMHFLNIWKDDPEWNEGSLLLSNFMSVTECKHFLNNFLGLLKNPAKFLLKWPEKGIKVLPSIDV